MGVTLDNLLVFKGDLYSRTNARVSRGKVVFFNGSSCRFVPSQGLCIFMEEKLKRKQKYFMCYFVLVLHYYYRLPSRERELNIFTVNQWTHILRASSNEAT